MNYQLIIIGFLAALTILFVVLFVRERKRNGLLRTEIFSRDFSDEAHRQIAARAAAWRPQPTEENADEEQADSEVVAPKVHPVRVDTDGLAIPAASEVAPEPVETVATEAEVAEAQTAELDLAEDVVEAEAETEEPAPVEAEPVETAALEEALDEQEEQEEQELLDNEGSDGQALWDDEGLPIGRNVAKADDGVIRYPHVLLNGEMSDVETDSISLMATLQGLSDADFMTVHMSETNLIQATQELEGLVVVHSDGNEMKFAYEPTADGDEQMHFLWNVVADVLSDFVATGAPSPKLQWKVMDF